MITRLFAVLSCAFALFAGAQTTPATNYTDMWWNPAESGWGVSFAQHSGTHQVFAVWYTYDPREQGGSGQDKPLWIVMPGGQWTSPTTITGNAYVATGVPFNQPGSNLRNTAVGSFTFTFSDASHGVFSYNIAAPPGLPPSDPAHNLPTLSGTKNITRQGF
ncbi:MAG TPA: hypothetical protein VM073_11275 [Usitatibacter sp.]|nr:hypothetical protein [Usitatibacter sp.]